MANVVGFSHAYGHPELEAEAGGEEYLMSKKATEERKKKRSFTVSGGITLELDIKYAPLQVLGSGAYGVVFRCVNRENNESVAIKKITDVFSNRITALRTLREMQILRQIHHDNVVSLKDVMISSDFLDVYLVQELMDADLHTVMKSRRMSNENCKWLLFQMLRGLQHLHSENVIHRDLKPTNILLNQNLDLKICDFGLARTKHEDAQIMTEYVVTRWYRAPELLTGSDWYGNGVDIWSTGCIFAEMLWGNGNPIFPGKDSLHQISIIHYVLGTQSDLSYVGSKRCLEYVSRLPCSPGLDFQRMFPHAEPLAVDLLKKMLVADPCKRISTTQALQHPYFSGIYDPATNANSAMEMVRLEVDEDPKAVDEKMIRDLIWRETLFYQPQQPTYRPREPTYYNFF